MKLIFIYGPPGVGKLTVAKILAKRTSYKLFHNHLTRDMVGSLFESGSRPFSELIRRYRYDMIEEAAKHRVNGVVFTYAYYARVDDKDVGEYVRRMGKYRAAVCFVQLTCSKKELERRVKRQDRKVYDKIHKVPTLRKLMKKYDIMSTAPFPNTLIIDNTTTSPARVATMIQKHWKL